MGRGSCPDNFRLFPEQRPQVTEMALPDPAETDDQDLHWLLHKKFDKILLNEITVLPGPNHFIAGVFTCHLEDKVPRISNRFQTFCESLEIRIALPDGDSTSTQQAVFNVHAADPFPVGAELIPNHETQGGTVP